MDLKIYSLERNPRLWLDSWKSLETFAKIISVTSISARLEDTFSSALLVSCWSRVVMFDSDCSKAETTWACAFDVLKRWNRHWRVYRNLRRIDKKSRKVFVKNQGKIFFAWIKSSKLSCHTFLNTFEKWGALRMLSQKGFVQMCKGNWWHSSLLPSSISVYCTYNKF